MLTRNGLLEALPEDRREALAALSHEVTYEAGARIFNEGGSTDRFWVIRIGNVALDVHVPGRQAAAVQSLGAGALLGWSWLIPPRTWHLGATALSAVQADEYDAAQVRALCADDPVLGQAVALYVAGIIGGRLRSSRRRLLDLYGPYGSGADL
ncbi:cyclic nucleotide-binding domain-containing protein [Streptomyces zagrosensis]|uniref:CRP-like cAMP-binding protein n=1 Tax=Streptomyces zagrosensis TaxID=1042984 RepID=A0A7W9QG60_9ACTN|nr:cyclic nucleotide-binding domain-containing protein [Streptomyces zagrosensis]MBB5938407.1 CRP-like cAMP-binding protein [Streptomyces zagrosensis]